MGGSGLAVPRFGADAVLSLLMPAQAAHAPKPADGKRKPPKQFRLGGPATVVTRTTLLHEYRDLDGSRGAFVQTTGQTVTGGETPDGGAEIAAALLSEGILRESDWCGSLDKSIRRGLARWIEQDMGCGSLRFFGPLDLLYTDDSAAYSAGARMHRWRDHFKGRADRPVAFFALRWQDQPRAVHVRRVVQALEKIWPGYGYGLIHLLTMTFQTAVNGNAFHWGARFLEMGEAAREAALLRWEEHDRNPFGAGGRFSDYGDELTMERFGDCVPAAAWQSSFRLDQAERIAAEAPRSHPERAPLTAQAMALWRCCRQSGLTFYTLNHTPFLSWEMFEMDRTTRHQRPLPIPRLFRAPTVVTVWDPDNDPMTRMTDDHTEACQSSMTYSDLTWMHCFQAGHAGVDPQASHKGAEAKERVVRKMAKKRPDIVAWYDPDYKQAELRDGGVGHAARALRLVLTIVRELDALLAMLHDPETLAERSKAGLL